MTTNTIEMITCRACQHEKEPSQFRIQSQLKNGRDSLCSECRVLHRRENGEYLRHLVSRHAKRAGQRVPCVTVEDYIDIFETYKDCPFCGIQLNRTNTTIDHVYPLSSPFGGKHIPCNLVACCRSCNASKSDVLSVYAFYQRKDSFTDELWRQFVQKWISRMIEREISEHEVVQMTQHLKNEYHEILAWKSRESEAVAQ